MSEVINYVSRVPDRVVKYSPRQSEREPRAWTIIANPNFHEAFMADYMDTENHMIPATREVIAKGLSADFTADLWTRYQNLRTAVTDTENADAHWRRWVRKQIPGHETLERPLADTMLVQALNTEEASLSTHGNHLHSVAEQMRVFLLGRLQLENMNGSRPADLLLPPPTLINPIEVVGMVALDLYQEA